MITAMILTTTLCAVNADNGYTIKDYIANYYSGIYRNIMYLIAKLRK